MAKKQKDNSKDNKLKNIEAALDKINKRFGKNSVMNMGETEFEPIPSIPTGSLSLDIATGIGGFPRGRIVEIYAGESAGKCVTKDMYIQSEFGLLTVEEILQELGMDAWITNKIVNSSLKIVNRYGELEESSAITFNGKKPIINIKLNNGMFLKTTHNHPHLYYDNVCGNVFWKKTGNLNVGDTLLINKKNTNNFGNSDNLTVEEGYLLGILIADGYFSENRIGFSNNNPKILDFFETQKILPKWIKHEKSDGFDYHINGKDTISNFYKKYGLKKGVAKDKFIPLIVRKSNKKTVQSFLQGYFDCESYFDKNKRAWEVCSASYKLLEQTLLLLQQFNIYATIHSKKVNNYPDNNYWRLIFHGCANLFESDNRNTISFDFLKNDIKTLYFNISKNNRTSKINNLFYDYMNNIKLTYNAWQKIKPVINYDDLTSKRIFEKIENLFDNYIPCSVLEINKEEPQPTYDLYVPKSSSFTMQGIITHNTTLTLHTIACAQKNGGKCAFVDAEHALDINWAENLGVSMDSLYLTQPDNGENALEITEMLIESNGFDVIVVDSVAALVPRAEIEGEMGDSRVGLQARLMSQAMRKITAKIKKSNTLVIFINQLREKIGVMFGDNRVTTGGNALKYYASMRIELLGNSSKNVKNKESGEIIAKGVKAKVVKNKVAPPFKKAEFAITFDYGIDKYVEILDKAVILGLINKSGSWFSLPDGTKIGQGSDNSTQFLKDNPELAEELELKILESYNIKRI